MKFRLHVAVDVETGTPPVELHRDSHAFAAEQVVLRALKAAGLNAKLERIDDVPDSLTTPIYCLHCRQSVTEMTADDLIGCLEFGSVEKQGEFYVITADGEELLHLGAWLESIKGPHETT